jgi:hypothetical protein
MATYAPNPTAKREPSGDQQIVQGISCLKVNLERAIQNTTEIIDQEEIYHSMKPTI